MEALEALKRIRAAHLARPALLLHPAELYRRLGRMEEAEGAYRAALKIDPAHSHGYPGLARVASRRRDFAAAQQSTPAGLQRLYFCPMAHFVLGVAMAGLCDDQRGSRSIPSRSFRTRIFPRRIRGWRAC